MEKFRYEKNELSMLENSMIPFGIYQYVDGRIVTVVLSTGLIELFELDADEAYELMDNNMYRDTDPEDVPRVMDAAVRFATEGKEYSVIYRSLIKGIYHIIHARGKHIYTERGERLAIVWYMDEGVYDKNDENSPLHLALEKEIKRTSEQGKGEYDFLTGLPGMNYFFELAEARIDKDQEKGEKPAILFFDFNGMKQYNIIYGFAEGDKLIKEMAALLVRFFSSENCCRFGGDRFVAYTVEEGLEKKLFDIFRECRQLNNGNSLPVRVGIYLRSMGRVGCPVACDRAKMACDVNRNCFTSVFSYFSEDMLEDTEKQQYIVDNLDKAITEGWIQVYFQPLIRSANDRVCDEEALARWIDPVKGFMSPGDFIPILENARLIYKLDLYVTDQILLKFMRQRAAGLYVVPCSVNISRSDFESCDIVEEIRRRVDAAGVDPSLLTIEITESILGGNVEYMKHQVERFHELGFKVWMDDYGSGYSSPEILQSVPFDTIKLDMQFMRQFDKGENSRIIINGLIKLAIGLGKETVAEGVETAEQVEFLKEAGCTKMQGFFFCKPIPLESVLERYEKGVQIGFENPAEKAYYDAIGRVNLYELSSNDVDDGQLKSYFNSMPMAVIEPEEDRISIVRCNKSFKDLITLFFKVNDLKQGIATSRYSKGVGSAFLKAVRQCEEEGGQLIIDETTRDGKRIHIMMKRVAGNPVTGLKAIAVAVLEIKDEKPEITYSFVAQALSADYLYLYYVDLDTERFIEYRPDKKSEEIVVERRGVDFFELSRRDAMKLLHENDREDFVKSFTKENVMRSIDEHGNYTYTYRLLINRGDLYVNMKAIRIGSDGKHIIIGVNNVDAQMRQKEVLERLKEERISFNRISALSGTYICFYSIDPYTDHYYEYSASFEYKSLGISNEGEDFFGEALKNSEIVLYKEDIEMFNASFTKENLYKKIGKGEVFSLRYRLMINGKPVPVRLKAALVNENGRQQLIIGISEDR